MGQRWFPSVSSVMHTSQLSTRDIMSLLITYTPLPSQTVPTLEEPQAYSQVEEVQVERTGAVGKDCVKSIAMPAAFEVCVPRDLSTQVKTSGIVAR